MLLPARSRAGSDNPLVQPRGLGDVCPSIVVEGLVSRHSDKEATGESRQRGRGDIAAITFVGGEFYHRQ